MRTFFGLLIVAACTTSSPSGSGGGGGGGGGGSGSSEQPPSCQDAATHFYGAGCYFEGSGSAMISETTFETDCQSLATQAAADGSACLDDANAWLQCLEDVPSPATSINDCDCSGFQMQFADCKG